MTQLSRRGPLQRLLPRGAGMQAAVGLYVHFYPHSRSALQQPHAIISPAGQLAGIGG